MSAFYLASSFLNKDAAGKVRDQLIAAGHHCTFDWMTFDDTSLLRSAVAQEEIDAVLRCDLFVLLVPGRLGAHTELGAALATRKPVLIIGDTSDIDCIFYDHPTVRFGDVEDALAMLAQINLDAS